MRRRRAPFGKPTKPIRAVLGHLSEDELEDYWGIVHQYYTVPGRVLRANELPTFIEARDFATKAEAAERARIEAEAARRASWPIHVVCLAWRRPGYLARTLASFAEHNHLSDFHLWYGLDCEPAPDAAGLLKAYGFAPLFLVQEGLLGIARMHDAVTRALARVAAPGDLCLVLEEDWRSVRPLPLAVVRVLLCRPDVQHVRVYGKTSTQVAKCKIKTTPAEGWHQEWVGGEPVWVGKSWWAHPPHVACLRTVQGATRGARDESVSVRRTRHLGCAWLRRPVFEHIGAVRSAVHLGGRT